MQISLVLAVEDAAAAVAWYKEALEARELWNLGSVVGLTIAGAPIFVGQPENNGWESPTKLGITSAWVEVFCDDPDAFIATAVAAGAQGEADQIRDHQMPIAQTAIMLPLAHEVFCPAYCISVLFGVAVLCFVDGAAVCHICNIANPSAILSLLTKHPSGFRR